MNCATNSNDFDCCIAQAGIDLLDKSRQGCLSECDLNKVALNAFKYEISSEFVPSGIELTPGFISSATLDLSSYAFVGDFLVGNILVEGNVIGILPENQYIDFDDPDPVLGLVTALVLAINTGGSPFTATNLTGGLILIETTNPSSEPNGFVITFQINPSIVATANLLDDLAFGQILYVDDPNSKFHEMVVAAVVNYGVLLSAVPPIYQSEIRLYKNGVEVTPSPIIFPLYLFPNTINCVTLCHDPANDRIYISGYGNSMKYFYVDDTFTTGPQPLSYYKVANGTNSALIIYNPFNPPNDKKYLICSAVGLLFIFTIDTNDVVVNLFPAGTGVSDILGAAVNPINGDVWICGATDIYILNTSGVIYDTVVIPSGAPADISYYPGDGTVGSERMFIAVFLTGAGNSYVMSVELDGTVDDPAFYTGITTTRETTRVFYSELFNLLFVNASGAPSFTDAHILHMDGTLKVSIPIAAKPFALNYVDDLKNMVVVTTATIVPVGEGKETTVVNFSLSDDGEEIFNQSLTGGVDPTYTTGEGNCVTQDQVDLINQQLSSFCSTITLDTDTPIPQGSFIIYYGNSSDDALDNTGVAALQGISATTYVGAYSFDATDPSEYKYIAIPAYLGTPSRFYDPLTNFDIPMTTVYQVTINFIVYNVYRTSFEIGSELQIFVQS